MARLLNDDRIFIRGKLITRAFEERQKAMKSEGSDLHIRVCQAAFGDHWTAVKKLPTEFFESNMSIRIGRPNHGGLSLMGHHPHIVPHRFDAYWQQARDGELDSKKWLPKALYELVVDWVKRATELEDEIQKATDQIQSLLNGITTYNKLFLTWPELKGVIPEPPSVVQKNQQMAPYLPALNKTLGLPVSTLVAPAKKAAKKAAS